MGCENIILTLIQYAYIVKVSLIFHEHSPREIIVHQIIIKIIVQDLSAYQPIFPFPPQHLDNPLSRMREF